MFNYICVLSQKLKPVPGLMLCLLSIALVSMLTIHSAASTAMANAAVDEAQDESAKDRGNLPEALEAALSQLLDAAHTSTKAPEAASLNEVLSFITAPQKNPKPAKRDHGVGVFFTETIRVPLKTLMSYVLNPAVPGEAIYPSSVRLNSWVKGSEVLPLAHEFLNSSLPPATPLIMRAKEIEETTPDTSSGCYYSYTLNRLFVLMPHGERTALFSISILPNESAVGKKGVIVGDDSKWNYVYTKAEGTNLPLLGWAKTHLYGSASVSVYLSSADNKTTSLYCFKWTKAGWSGMNVVKAAHITAGIKRFADGMKQVMESKTRPSPEAIKARMDELNAMDDASLRQAMAPYVEHLKTLPDLKGEYADAVREQNYPASMTRRQLLADLIRTYMRDQIKP